MKNFCSAFLAIALLLATGVGANGQEQVKGKISVALGFGIPELINANVGFTYRQTTFLAGYGFYPESKNWVSDANDPSVHTVYGNVAFHLAGHSKYTQVRPFYLRTGANYFFDYYDSYFLFPVQIGREFNFSERIGVDLYIGLSIFSQSQDFWFNALDYVAPNAGARLFVRF